MRPVAASLSDQDNRVRYYACEALFNITKSMHDEFMTNQPLFIEVFSSLFKLYGDPDEHVQNAATHLDEVLKSIVMSSSEFDVDCFVQMLKGFFKAPDPHKRQFLIGWVTALFSVPELDMLAYLPDIAGGMLEMLVDEHKEIRHAAAKALQVCGKFQWQLLQDLLNTQVCAHLKRNANRMKTQFGIPDLHQDWFALNTLGCKEDFCI